MALAEYSFHLEHYDAWICFLIGGEIKDFKSFLKSRYGRIPVMYSWDDRQYAKDMEDTDAYQAHVNYKPPKHDEIFYLWMSHEKILVHEIIHLAGDILFVRGFTYCKESEEAWAYTGNEIYNRITTFLNANKD